MIEILNFIDYLKFEKNYSNHTIQSYHTDLNQFASFISERYEANSLLNANTQWIRSWLAELMELKNATRTIHRKMSTVKSFYKYLLKNDLIKINPAVNLEGPRQAKRLAAFVEESKMNLLFRYEDKQEPDFETLRNRLMLELFYSTGIRRAELIDLTDHSLNGSQNILRVTGKRNKQRIIPLSADMTQKLQNYLELRNKYFDNNKIDNSFFITKKGKKLYPKLVYRIVNSYLSKVSTQEKKSPHVLRHTFATHLLNNGADLNAVKELLGHANLAATQIYTHNTIEKLKEVYKQAHPKA
jgi:integrase/recombinase XerC